MLKVVRRWALGLCASVGVMVAFLGVLPACAAILYEPKMPEALVRRRT